MFKSIKTTQELSEVLSSKENEGKIVVLDFWAGFCVPCKNLKDSLQKNISKFSDKAVIYTVDTQDDEAYDLVTEHKIRNLPTLIFYKDGKDVDRFTGNLVDNVIEVINKHA